MARRRPASAKAGPKGFGRRRGRVAVGDQRGQMTVELAAAFPVLIVVAVIAVNSCTFFYECAVFDRVASEAVRVHAAAPAYGQSSGTACASIEQALLSELDAPNVAIGVSHGVVGADFDKYTATLEYYPTLFGMGLRPEVFGVALPHLTHEVSLTVDTYKAGVVI